ncbi:ATP-binding protein [Streptomyces sp. NBC_01304]|uniref:ATP-binding protein n=1 Tax=Streptomyces sp. NBC_01304 TaxID=2903818 RepID=UPI002E0F450F|nr:ATP-binding protein [Streptomyces sp. NBC_01304]
MAFDSVSASEGGVRAVSGPAGRVRSEACVRYEPEWPPLTVATATAITVPAELAELDRVAEFVLRLGGQAGLADSALYRLRLAADELATNIVMHGYRDIPGGRVSVAGGIEADRVWVRFVDDAPAFDPRQGMRAPDRDMPLEQREIGGLGVYLAFTSVDTFDYELVAGRNVSTLTMRRSSAAGVQDSAPAQEQRRRTP